MNQELKDKAAKILCEIIDDNAPIGWEKYRSVVVCLASNDDFIEILIKLNDSEK